jgi:fibronectin type 3 domain-containing protein
VTLTWVAPSSTDVAAYNVYRSKSAIGPFLRRATVAAAEHEYVDKSVEAGETYYYALTSVSLDGMESADSTLAIAPVP